MNPRDAQRQYDNQSECDHPDYDRGERLDAAEQAIWADTDRIAGIISTEAQNLDGEAVDAMMAILATARNSGLIKSLSSGTPAYQLKGIQLETFRVLSDACDLVGGAINDAVAKEAAAELERQAGGSS